MAMSKFPIGGITKITSSSPVSVAGKPLQKSSALLCRNHQIITNRSISLFNFRKVKSNDPMRATENSPFQHVCERPITLTISFTKQHPAPTQIST